MGDRARAVAGFAGRAAITAVAVSPGLFAYGYLWGYVWTLR